MNLIDSDRRCPYCRDRMVVDVGQDDDDTASGWVRMVHQCISPDCDRDYTEIDENWRRPSPTRTSSQTAAGRLLALRMGIEVPLMYAPAEPAG